jgi:hypothetical protein
VTAAGLNRGAAFVKNLQKIRKTVEFFIKKV